MSKAEEELFRWVANTPAQRPGWWADGKKLLDAALDEAREAAAQEVDRHAAMQKGGAAAVALENAAKAIRSFIGTHPDESNVIRDPRLASADEDPEMQQILDAYADDHRPSMGPAESHLRSWGPLGSRYPERRKRYDTVVTAALDEGIAEGIEKARVASLLSREWDRREAFAEAAGVCQQRADDEQATANHLAEKGDHRGAAEYARIADFLGKVAKTIRALAGQPPEGGWQSYAGELQMAIVRLWQQEITEVSEERHAVFMDAMALKHRGPV